MLLSGSGLNRQGPFRPPPHSVSSTLKFVW